MIVSEQKYIEIDFGDGNVQALRKSTASDLYYTLKEVCTCFRKDGAFIKYGEVEGRCARLIDIRISGKKQFIELTTAYDLKEQLEEIFEIEPI